jgi:hypothetical protein
MVNNNETDRERTDAIAAINRLTAPQNDGDIELPD